MEHLLRFQPNLAQVLMSDSPAKMGLQLKIQGPRGEKKILDVCENEQQLEKMSVQLLKKKIIQHLGISGDLRMVYKAVTMEESAMVSTYGITHLATITTLLVLPGGV